MLKTSFAVSEKFSAFYTGGQLQVTSDGGKLFCGCGKEIKVVDLKTGRVEATFGHEEEEEITQFIVTKDDEFLILATQNLLFRQWKWKEKLLVKTWRSVHNAPVSSLAFDPSVTLLASGSADHTTKVWDIVRGYYTHNFRGHTGVVRLTAFHPNPEKLQLVTAAEDYTVKIWDLSTSALITSSQCHTSLVTSVAFADNGETMYSGGKDNVVCVWKTAKWKVFKTVPVFEPIVSLVVPLEFPSLVDEDEGSKFVTVSATGFVRVVNAQSGKREYSNSCRLSDANENDTDADAYVTQAIYCPDLNGIVMATYDQNIILLSKDFTTDKQLCGHLDDVLSVKLVGKEDSHIAVATNTDLLKVFHKETWECQMLQGHTDIITCLDVHLNYIVSASKDSTIRLWQLCQDTGYVTCIGSGQGHTQSVQAAALAKTDSRPTFVASGGVDLTLKLWSFPSESDTTPMAPLRVAATEHAHDKDINSIAVAPNNKILATGSQDKTAKIWSLADGLHSLTLLAVLRGHKRGVWAVQFSPVDQVVATASGDGNIKMWSISDFGCIRTFEGHDSSVLSINFLSQGRQILSSGSDGLLKLWVVKTSECATTLDGHDAKVWTTAVSSLPGEPILLSGGADSSLILWKDMTEEEEQAKLEQVQKQILQEQVLSNLIADKKFVRALGLAISLNRPYMALNVMKEIINQDDGEKQLEKLLNKLKMEQIGSLLKFAVDWNTNSRHSRVAQTLLGLVLRTYLPSELLKLPGIQTTIEALMVYTERHLQRLDNLLIDSHFADYSYRCMKTV